MTLGICHRHIPRIYHFRRHAVETWFLQCEDEDDWQGMSWAWSALLRLRGDGSKVRINAAELTSDDVNFFCGPTDTQWGQLLRVCTVHNVVQEARAGDGCDGSTPSPPPIPLREQLERWNTILSNPETRPKHQPVKPKYKRKPHTKKERFSWRYLLSYTLENA